MAKTALLFNSRNNYELFEKIFFTKTSQDFTNYPIYDVNLRSGPDPMLVRKELIETRNLIDGSLHCADYRRGTRDRVADMGIS